jgi:N-acetylneuraminate synthase
LETLNNKEVFIIAEIGQAHDGSLGLLHSYIDAVKNTGVDAIKFQTHIASAESSSYEPFRINFSYEDETRYDYWKRMEFSKDQWAGIKAHCEEANLEFMSSPFSIEAFHLLNDLGMKKFKIGSGEVTNNLLIDLVAQTGKDIILSSGMSSYDDIEKAIKRAKTNQSNVSILQCTTSYPTPAEKVGLNVIHEMQKTFSIPVGLSDHSGTIYPAIAATALGAEIIEVHVTFDKMMFGPDASSSLTIEELKRMVEGVRFTTKVINNPQQKLELPEMKAIFEKSLALNKDMKAGSLITIEDLETKKPAGYGLPASSYEDFLNKKINKDIQKSSFLRLEDLK